MLREDMGWWMGTASHVGREDVLDKTAVLLSSNLDYSPV